MEKHRISRKERRKAEQNKLAYSQLKKGTTVLSSAVVVSSIAAPIAAPKIAEAAEEQPTAEISYSDTAHTQNVQDVTGTSNDSSDTQTAVDEEPTSGTSSETQETSESNTSETIQSTEQTEPADNTTATDAASTTESSESEELQARSAISTFAASTRSITPSAFISEIAGHASTAAAASDLYASVMIAQAILESDWGRSALSAAPNYNLFGIKGSYQGQSVYMKTWEVINGQNVYIDAAFRKYPSPLESFYDNAYVLKNTSFQSGVYYYAGTWKSNTRSYKDATAYLTGRYATDPNYGTKLNSIIESYGLTQYDTPASGSNSGNNSGSSTGNTGGNTTNTNTGSSTSDTYHTVKAGDSLWALASQYGTTIANIKSWNNLSSDMIYVGQKLIVKKGSSNTGSSNNNNNSSSSSNSSNNSSSSNSTSGSNTYYTVKSGDSLWAISNANGVSIANLRQWNNLSGDIIYPGQKLIVKKGSSSSSNSNSSSSSNNNSNSSSNNNSSSNTSSTNSYYTVKSGDSLWAIANANGTSIANLRQWNSLSGDIIYPGQKLIVKKGSGSSSSSSSNSNNTSSNSTSSAGTSSSSASASYTVKSGDSLWAIANANGVSVANLRQWNSLSGDIIYPGQKLVVKKGGSSSNSASSSTSQSSSQTGSTHVVKSGNTLWGLAQQYGTSVQKLKQLNNLSSDIIYIGQTLKVK
ncbi:LysM peptidoglycan-binding domain-containing protein [Erwinia sp. CPCC 100877]|nr:LysM peptidoglycan-binding domain-containing protein [Erwinia sp. CPCC 100877]